MYYTYFTTHICGNSSVSGFYFNCCFFLSGHKHCVVERSMYPSVYLIYICLYFCLLCIIRFRRLEQQLQAIHLEEELQKERKRSEQACFFC